jgi:hypothetical protein
MIQAESPTVFVTYSHDSKEHKDWVRQLSEDLVRKGITTTLDQWHLKVGDDIVVFMERSIKNSTYVILVCTERFADKTNTRAGGVGYEQTLIGGELLARGGVSSRFLPILRSGEPSRALPFYLQSKVYIDFRDDHTYPAALDQLVRGILNENDNVFKPPARVNDIGQATHQSSKNAVLNPPRDWILVAGTGNVKLLDNKVKSTSVALGKALAKAGYGLITGGWPGVDELTARNFAIELEQLGLPLEDRLLQVVRNNKIPPFSAGRLIQVNPGKAEWEESVNQTSAIILIGGVGGTWETGEYGINKGRVVLPLADTGGDAAKFYMHMDRMWEPHFLPGVEKKKWSVIAREAPQVVERLINLLDDWQKVK